MKLYKTFSLKSGNTLNVYYDEGTENPRNLDNVGFCAFFGKWFDIGDQSHFDSFEKLAQYTKRKDVISLPVYMVDNTSQRIGLTPNGDAIGFIYVNTEYIREEQGVKRVSPKLRENILSVLKSEVEILDSFIKGDVFCVEVVDEKGDIVDSDGGFYGTNFHDNFLFDYVVNQLDDEVLNP